MKTLHLAAALLISTALIGCGDDKEKDEVKIYSSVEECKADNSDEDCNKAFSGAQTEHESSAPRMNLDQCVNAYGSSGCQPRNGGDFFVPAMAGFMIGQMMANQSRPYQPVYVDLGGRAYSRNTNIGSYHPGNYGYGTTTTRTTVRVAPNNTTWARSYAPTKIVTKSSKPSPPSYDYGPSKTEHGGFGRSASTSSAAPASKTQQDSTGFSPPPRAPLPGMRDAPSRAPPSAPSTYTRPAQAPRPAAAPAPSPSRPSYSSPSSSSSSRGGGFGGSSSSSSSGNKR